MCLVRKVLFIFSCLFITITSQQGEISEGDFCQTPRQESGVCVSITNCEFVKRIFLTFGHNNRDVNNYVSQLTCGFVGRTPLVCCPNYSNGTRSGKAGTTVKPTVSVFESTTSVTTKKNVDTTPKITTDGDPTRENLTSGTFARLNNHEFLRPPQCGKTTFTGGYRVVGGFPAKLGNFPWMATLGYRNSKNPILPKWLCGGALITKIHVLTAAHCVETTEKLYIVRIGDLDLYSDDDGANPVDVLVSSTKTHEGYNPRLEYTNDIAIITLAEEVNRPNLPPICIPFEEPLKSNKFARYYPYVAGWGSQKFRGPTSTILLTTNLMVVENDKCAKNLSEFEKVIIDDRTICAGFAQGGKDACKGDSGGPLMHGVAEGRSIRFYIIGIVSFGYNCALPGYPGVYTRITHYIDWIQKNL